MGFTGHWKTYEGLGQWLTEAAGGTVWGGLRILKKVNEEHTERLLRICSLGFGWGQLRSIKRPDIELFSISRR